MSRVARLQVVLGLDVALLGALVAVGLRSHSLGVLAAGGDFIADAVAVCLSLLAIWMSRRPPTAARPGGRPNATNVAALVNAGWLLVLSILVAFSAAHRLVSGAPRIEGLPVLVVSACAAVGMGLGAVVLAGHRDDGDGDTDGGDGADGDADLNLRAVLLDTVADATAAAGVAVTGAVIFATGRWYWLDPAVALAISIVVGYHAVKLLRRVVAALRRPRLAGEDVRR